MTGNAMRSETEKFDRAGQHQAASGNGGLDMPSILRVVRLLPLATLLFAWGAQAQSFRVQCPSATPLHPLVNAQGQTGKPDSTLPNPHIKCQQLGGGDGFASMADGTQTYLFSFGPLSGLGNIVHGLPGTVTNAEFMQSNVDPHNGPVGPDGVLSAVKIGAPDSPDYSFNGAIGLVPDPDAAGALTGHVDPRLIMDVGVMNGNIPAPMIAIDEGDELFLTLTNVGMIMRPDLFEQHTVHFHGYPNASAFYDGVPDASVAINIGGSFTYYYLAPEAGTYMWHCHISPPEHLQMGMVGQLYVRPKQNSATGSLRAALQAANAASATSGNGTFCNDILCAQQTPLPPANTATANGTRYAYNDGDGSTAYDVEYPIQMHGFDPNFHFVGMTFNPEGFADMKDKYFLLNGRSYPDTVSATGPMQTQSADGVNHFSQPMNSVINIPVGGKALLRISELNVSEYHTLATLGIPMHVVGWNAKLLRDQTGNNMDYYTNSITLGGGESADVILDASDTTKYQKGQVFYVFTSNLDHLSNDAENFGGQMTEVHICTSVDSDTKACTI
jgi:FtsP/CotA-like multicopper oxidase with cupredoxin domain